MDKTTKVSWLTLLSVCLVLLWTAFGVFADETIIFKDDFINYTENMDFSKNVSPGIGPWAVNSSGFTGKIVTYPDNNGKCLKVTPPTSGGGSNSILWFQNVKFFGTDSENGLLQSGIITLQNDYKMDTELDDTVTCASQITMWDDGWRFLYYIKGSKIYDVRGNNIADAFSHTYPIGEWFTLRTTIYVDTQTYDLDMITSAGTVRLKTLGEIRLPKGGIKRVRFYTSYNSDMPTFREPMYYDNFLIKRTNPEQPILSNDAEIYSQKYIVDNSRMEIRGIYKGTTVAEVMGALEISPGAMLRLYDESMVNRIFWGEVTDGMRLSITSQNEQNQKNYVLETKPKANYNISDQNGLRTISATANSGGSNMLIVARYDSQNCLIDITTADTPSEVGTLTVSNIPIFAEETMKVFLWDNKIGIKPLQESPSIDFDGRINIPLEGKPWFSRPSAQQVLADFLKTNQENNHPRLYADKGDFERLRQLVRTDALVKSWYNRVKGTATNILSQPPLIWELRDGIRLLYVSQDATNRIYSLAMVYQIEGDVRYAQRAYEEMAAISAFPNWNPTHFLDTAQMLHGIAVGYDWLYDYMDAEQRTIVSDAIINLGLNEYIAAYQDFEKGITLTPTANPKSWWTRSKGNWNVWCNSGGVAAAVAIADEQPELSANIIAHSLESLELSLPSFAPDGGYEEGIGYGAIAFDYLVKLSAALEGALGTEYGYFNRQGVAEFAYFLNYMNGPVTSFNFHDSGDNKIAYLDEAFYVSRKVHAPDIGNLRKTALEDGKTVSNIFDMLWYNAEQYNNSQVFLPLDRYFRKVETGSLRSDWNSAEALWLGFHGGDSSVGHAHLDSGTFVFDALGLNWALDLGSEPLTYTGTPEQRGDPYLLYRFDPQGHNTIRIDADKNRGQLLNSFCPVIKFESNSLEGHAIMDLTPAYAHKANNMRRGFALTNERSSIVIQDEISLKSAGDIWWSMHTTAQIDVLDGGKTAILSQQDKQVKVILYSDCNEAHFLALTAEPLEGTMQNEYQMKNEGIQKLAICIPSVLDAIIRVEFIPIALPQDMSREAGAFIPLTDW